VNSNSIEYRTITIREYCQHNHQQLTQLNEISFSSNERFEHKRHRQTGSTNTSKRRRNQIHDARRLDDTIDESNIDNEYDQQQQQAQAQAQDEQEQEQQQPPIFLLKKMISVLELKETFPFRTRNKTDELVEKFLRASSK
jgi:hypothetical protein